jgi:integrase
VTPEVILAWQRRLAADGGTKDGRPLAANTIRLARAPLAGAFKLAVQTGIVPANPVSATPPPSAGRRIPRHWSPEQAREFLDLMEGDRTWPVWGFLLGSGLRIGELVWLRWPNVDLARRRVRVVEFATVVDYELVASVGKSAGAVRSIELDNHLVGVLKSQRGLQADEGLASPRYEASDYVFTRLEGGAYHPQYLSRTLAGYSTELGLPRLTAHGLRHTSATLMLANGVPPKVAAERLGHADPTLFMNLYSHVTPTMQREAAEKIGKILFSKRGARTVRG